MIWKTVNAAQFEELTKSIDEAKENIAACQVSFQKVMDEYNREAAERAQ